MDCPKRVWIVYATQTGKAEKLSNDVKDQLWKVGVIGYPTSIDLFESIFFEYFEEENEENLTKKLQIQFPLTIFILSTTGQGEVPDTMVSFWNRILLNNLNTKLLATFQFTIFGMGDRCFGNSRFNITARKLRHLLLNYGAVEKIPWGLGDESHDFGVLGEYDPWIDNVTQFFVSSNQSVNEFFQNNSPICKYKCEIISHQSDEFIHHFDSQLENELKNSILIQKSHINQMNQKNVFISSLLSNQECDQESKNKTIKKIKFAILNENDKTHYYKPGTHIAVWPVNPIDKVLQFINLFNTKFHPKTIIQIKINQDFYQCLCNKKHQCEYNSNQYTKCFVQDENFLINCYFPLNENMSLFTLIYRYLDIMNIPDRRFINKCYHSTNNNMHKERLKEMINNSLDSRKDYCDYIRDEHRNYIELLWDFNSIKLEIDDIINLIPIIIPRYYSICNTFNWYQSNLWRYIEYYQYMKRITTGLIHHDQDHHSLNVLLLPEIISNRFAIFLPKAEINSNNQLRINNYYNQFKLLRKKILNNYLIKAKLNYFNNIINEFKNVYYCQNNNIVEICVNIIQWNTVFNRKIHGLCSNYLDNVQFNNKTLVAFENKLGDEIIQEIVNPKIPVLLLSCGLGITGIISILQERVINIFKQDLDSNLSIKNKTTSINNTLVYIGLRYSNVMYPYIDQIYEFSARRELYDQVKFNISYSRKNPGISESIFHENSSSQELVNLNCLKSGCYIQSLLLEEDEENRNMREYIINCILNGYVIICGNALTMPIEIRETLGKILVLQGKFETIEDSLVYIKKLIRYGRYIEETWV